MTSGSSRPRRAGAALIRALLAIGVAAGCTSVQQGGSQTLLMKATDTKMSAGELRSHTNELAVRVPAMIEAGADQIAAKSSDPAIRRRAILWKAQTIPAFYQAFFRPDPLAAAIDGYTLSIQLQQALETGSESSLFGPEQPIALETAQVIRALIQGDFHSAAKDPSSFDRFNKKVEEWARAHPIEGLIATRQTMIPSLAQLAGTGDTSVFEVVGSVDATLNDLATRIDVYEGFVPKQVQWQAELMAYEVAGRDEFRDVLATLRSLHQFSDTANALFSPQGIRDEQNALFAAMTDQRIAAMNSIEQERTAAFDAIREERSTVFRELDREKLEMMKQVEDLRGEVVGDVNRAIDRVMWRIAGVFSALLVGAALLALVVLRLSRGDRGLPKKSTPGAS